MEPEVGSILEGKVTSIMKFGAFVSLGNGRSGLVHISEIANTFVNDVHDFLQEGQEVKVKVISIDQANRINLSIKQVTPPPQRNQTGRPHQGFQNGGRPPRPQGERRSAPNTYVPRPAPKEPTDFEDKLKQFMQSSDSKLSELRYMEKKNNRRSGGNRRG